MKLKLFIFVLLSLLVASCTSEDLPEPAEKGEEIVTISATIPTETRVAYDDTDLSLSWEENDQLMLVGFDDNDVYKGKSIFTKSGTGNTFSGLTVADATKYKAYYPATVTLDGNGNVQPFDADFWEQEQYGNNNTAHLRDKLLLFDETANALNVAFDLILKSSIIKFALSDIPTDIGAITKLVWTVQHATGWAPVVLDVTNVTSGTTDLTAYLAFDPSTISIAADGVVKVTLCGEDLSYVWSKTVTDGMDYEAGKRYTGAASGWNPNTPLIYVTEYNVNPAGDGFVTTLTPKGDDNGFFSFNDAVANFSDITIGNKRYHLPSEAEWRSIVSHSSTYVHFANQGTHNNIEESVSVLGQDVVYNSDYITGVDNTFAYALRYKGSDMVSAWRYERVGAQGGTNAHMIVTSRNVYGQTAITVEDIATADFWSSNTGNDVVRYFPASGVKVGNNYYSESYGLFWSSTEVPVGEGESIEGYFMRFDSGNYNANRGSDEKTDLYSVRLFVSGN
ncbi:MAG: hypothetical protein QM305_14405 [Bacteroidota bacterium]|jgi:hypothetical protein|nr:hypothetical protein [Bacteroidota bacterium]